MPKVLVAAFLAGVWLGGSVGAQNRPPESPQIALERAEDYRRQARSCRDETKAWATVLGRETGFLMSAPEGLEMVSEVASPSPVVNRRCDELSLFRVGIDVGKFSTAAARLVTECIDEGADLRTCHEGVLQLYREVMAKHDLPLVPPIEARGTLGIGVDQDLARTMGMVVAFYGHRCDSITSASNGDRIVLTCNMGAYGYTLFNRDGSLNVAATTPSNR